MEDTDTKNTVGISAFSGNLGLNFVYTQTWRGFIEIVILSYVHGEMYICTANTAGMYGTYLLQSHDCL